MATESSMSSVDSLSLRTQSELQQWGEKKLNPSKSKRFGYLKVIRWNSEIFRSGTFTLSEESLKNVLDLLSLRFSDTPHGLRFSLVTWVIGPTQPVMSTTTLNSQLRLLLIPEKSGLGKVLKVSIKSSKAISSIYSSIAGSEAKVLKKTNRRTLGLSRVKTPRVSPELETQVVSIVDSTKVGSVNSTVNLAVYQRTFSSVRTPGFHLKSRTGQLPMNPYTMNQLRLTAGPFSDLKVHGNGDFFNRHQSHTIDLTLADLGTGHLSIDENLLIAKLKGKISSSTNLAETFAQSGQGVRLVVNSINRFHTFLTLIRGGSLPQLTRFLNKQKGSNKFVTGVKVLREGGLNGVELLSTLWLEYRYAWKPLVSDVDTSLNLFAAYAAKNPTVRSVSSSKRSSSQLTRKVAFVNVNGQLGYRLFYEDTTTVCRMGIKYRLDSPQLTILSNLGLTSPIALGWELIPFSFVVDWWLPIGPALGAFSAFEGLAFKSGYKTYFTKKTVFLKTDVNLTFPSANPAAQYQRVIKGQSFGDRVSMTRTALTGFPSTSMPRFKNPFSLIHAANAAALVAKLLVRSVR